MTPPPISLCITYVGGTQFIAESGTGTKVCMGASPHPEGGCSCSPHRTNSPLDVFVSSLGGCVGIAIISNLSEKGFTPDSFILKINASRNDVAPYLLEKIHLNFTVSGALYDHDLKEAIQTVISSVCPIALAFSRIADITWEYQIV